MSRYDLHQHLWPEPLVRELERRSEPPRLRSGRLELAAEGAFEVDLRVHDLDARVALLDRHELDVGVVSLAPTMETDGHADLIDAYHEGIAELVAAAGGRLAAFAADPALDGFAGVCVSAGRLVGGIDEILGRLAEDGGLLFVHPGPPAGVPAGAPAWWAAVVEYTAQMQAAYATWLWRDAARFPSVPVLFAILAGGAPIQLERLGSRGVGTETILRPNGFFDTSSYGAVALGLCLDAYGATQLAFGSDAPVIEPGPTLRAVACLGDEIEQLVLHENPSRLLGQLPA